MVRIKLHGNEKCGLFLFVSFHLKNGIKKRGGPWSVLNCKEMGSEVVFCFCLFVCFLKKGEGWSLVSVKLQGNGK